MARGWDLADLSVRRNGSPAIVTCAGSASPAAASIGAPADRPVLGGRGLGVVSTNLGLLSDRQARERGVGGEVLCEIW
jgi:small subunit ribosomal protein S8